ncbi:MAG: hypothetical protein F6J87_15655 [Spirulina sp. SIO3F2]|nr:hypothetical protein [Spirulina sp. SIO3F2]
MCVTPQPYRLPRRLPNTVATAIYTPRNLNLRPVPTVAPVGLPIRYRQNVVVEPCLGAVRPPMPQMELAQ